VPAARSRTPFVRAVERTAQRHALFAAGSTVVLAVSGGADSVCLAHVLHALAPRLGLTLHVAHLDHGWRGAEAAADAAFAARLAARLALPFHQAAVDAPAYARAERLSPEEAARTLRYAFLRDVCLRTGAATVATGHNQDDRVETALIAWLRGSGPGGVAGMAWSGRLLGAPEPALAVVRPLLDHRRDEIRATLRAWGEAWREDRSNDDPAYLRNRVRRDLVPLLEALSPGFRVTTLRSLDLLHAAAAFLRREAARAGAALFTRTPRAMAASCAAFLALDPALQSEVLRWAVAQLQHDTHDLEWRHVDAALETIRRGRGGAKVAVSPTVCLVLRRGQVVLQETPPPTPHER
jgi:tRNA(Ile)-lysidine synthase